VIGDGRREIENREETMRTSVLRTIFCVAIATVAINQIPAAEQEGFALTVVAPEKRLIPVTVWLGIRNGTEDVALMCVSSVGAWTLPPEGPSRGSAEGFSPHACVNDEAYTRRTTRDHVSSLAHSEVSTTTGRRPDYCSSGPLH